MNLAWVFFLVVANLIVLAAGWWWFIIIRPMQRAWQAGRPIPLASSLALQASIGGVAITSLLGAGFWDLVTSPQPAR